MRCGKILSQESSQKKFTKSMSGILKTEIHWFFKLLFGLLIFVSPVCFILIILPNLLPIQYVSNSDIAGFILRDQVWEGTIKVKGDIFTALRTTITLKPGTVILVSINNDKTNVDYLPWHLRSGINIREEYHGVRNGEPFWDETNKIQLHFARLNAEGTKEQPIIIRSDSPGSTSSYDINSITIGQGTINNTSLSNYRRLEVGDKVTIRNSHFNHIGECAICITSGKPQVLNNFFENIRREAIWVYKSAPVISGNFFVNLIGAGIRIDPQAQGQPNITHNSFEMPNNLAVDILSGSEDEAGSITYNYFAGSSLISLPCDSKISFIANSLMGSIKFSNAGCNFPYIFGSNYWGTKEIQSIIDAKIIGKEKTLKILIPALLNHPPKTVGKFE